MTASTGSRPLRVGRAGSGAVEIGDRELMTMLSAVMALMALAIDLLLPAFDEIRASYGLAEGSNDVAQVITAFFMGLSLSQLVWGPLADRFGRKVVLYTGFAVYVAGAVGSALAPGLGLLLFFRFVWGTGAAAARVVVTAIVRDRFGGVRMAEAMSQIMAVFVLVPVVAPALGSVLVALLPWRSVFWFCVVWAVGVGLWSRRLPETLDPDHRRPFELRPVLSGFREVARNRQTACTTVSTLFIQGVFISYIGSSERIISVSFDRESQFPYVFGAIALLFGIGALVNHRAVGRFGVSAVVHVAFAAVLSLAVYLVVLSAASSGDPTFWAFMPALGLILGLFMVLLPNLNTVSLEPMGALAGTASSVTGAARIAGGAVLGGFVNTLIGDSLTPFTVAIMVFVVLAIGSLAVAERSMAIPVDAS